MTHTHELTAITRLRSIETAERYLIARTRAEIGDTVGKGIVAAVDRPVWAIGLTATIIMLLHIGFIRDLMFLQG